MAKIKNLFSTPKRAVISVILIAAAVGIIGLGFVFVCRTVVKNRSIGESRAEQIALADAGETASQARFNRTDFSFDDGSFVYEVEFFTDNGEFEYTIAAVDGTIIDRDMEWYSSSLKSDRDSRENQGQDEVRDYRENSQEPAANTEAAGIGTDDIGINQAKEIALQHAGLDGTNVTFTEAKPDREDGRAIYELEFWNGRNEYDYKIQASDGKILECDVDYDHDHGHDHD